MHLFKPRPILMVIALSLLVSSCAEKTATNKKTSNPTQPPTIQPTNPPGPTYPGGGGTGGSGHGNGNEPGISDGGQTQEYITIQGIVLHGTANPNTNNPAGVPLWNSQTNFDPNDQHIFTTNSRFNLRVVARNRPSQNTNDVRGVSCRYQTSTPYKKLKVSVCVRSASGNCNNFNTTTFDDIPVNQASKIKNYPVPATAQPLVVEVRDLESDLFCEQYKQMGVAESEVPGYCPFSSHSHAECVEFDLQFSTDDTKDIPGPRL
jgi:hypothetical protein